jgi:DNA polymerase-3 subunit alpha
MDGLSLPEEMILTAKEKGLKSIAITDHGVAHAHADFYLSAKKHGVRAIFGVEAYVIDSLEEWRKAKEAKDEGEDEDATNVGSFKAAGKKGHLVLLACNREGLANLYQLIYRAHKDGFYGKPRMDKAMLREHSRGLVASSACMGGVISNLVWQHTRGEVGWDAVVRAARDYGDIFGYGRFFLELQLNESEYQKTINKALIKIHEETNIPLTVTTDSHYIKDDDWAHQEIIYMLRSKKTVATRGADWNFDIKQLYIKSPQEMWESYEKFGADHIPQHVIMEAFENTLLIDSLVDTFEPDTTTHLPKIIGVEGDSFKELGVRCINALKKKGLGEDEKYTRQLLHELKVIKDKGFGNYFLLVQTMVNEAKKEMLVGPGRGSAAGSLVCYLLGITDLDPLKHELLFERFLDPNRLELPDIDIDFEDPDRAKKMMAAIYGEDNVAALTSYGTFQIKGLMKDLARVYDLDHNEVNKINKKIEAELRVLYSSQDGIAKDKSLLVITLDDVERVCPSFNDFCKKFPAPAAHFRRLYGRNRHVGRHAAGIIIGDNLPAETAIFKTRDKESGLLVTQASFTEGLVNKNISAMGFVKFDILGLATLQVIHHAIRLVGTKLGRTPEDIWDNVLSGDNLDLDDQKVLKHVFHDGNFAGIFQFTNKGIRKVAKGIKPSSFKDVSAVTALYRPGPLGSGMHKLYAGNKKLFLAGELTFEHPVLKEVLEPTYGCIIYQEQMLQLGSKMGLLSGKDTQRLRKLLLKRDKSKLDSYLDSEETYLHAEFLKGCEKNNWPKGEETWAMMKKFGGYGFNKAHSDAYSKVSMQTAWLATYHPLEFYSALLTKGQSGDIQDYITDIKKAGIKVLPVDINESKGAHRVQDKSIRLSLRTVNGVGVSAIEKIIAHQPYTDWFDFIKRSGATKTAIQPLIMVGAFDKLEKNMKKVEQMYDLFLSDTKFKSKKWDEYKFACDKLEVEDYELHHKVALENALLGFSVRGSPFEILGRKKKIEAVFGDTTMTYGEFMESTDELAMMPVVIKEWKERAQRNGKMFAFIKFGTEDGTEFEAPAFANLWTHISGRVRKGMVYIGTFNRKLDEPENLLLGRAGFAQSAHSAQQALISVDEIEL